MMTGADLKAIRKRAGLSLLAFGRRLGYAGSPRTVARKVRRYEASPDPLPPPVVMRTRALKEQK